jgi:hypothetical protein
VAKIAAMAGIGERIWKVYKMARWLMLLAIIGVALIALRRPAPATAPPAPAQIKENADSLEQKLQQLEQQHQSGEPNAEVRLSDEEVNSFIAQNTATAPAPAPDAEPIPEVKPAVAFVGDEVIAQAVVRRYGQDIYVTVRGRLGARNGYLTFSPTGFKIGELSIPVSLVDAQLQQKLSDPENHAKLKLPDFISDLRIENGELVVVEK